MLRPWVNIFILVYERIHLRYATLWIEKRLGVMLNVIVMHYFPKSGVLQALHGIALHYYAYLCIFTLKNVMNKLIFEIEFD